MQVIWESRAHAKLSNSIDEVATTLELTEMSSGMESLLQAIADGQVADQVERGTYLTIEGGPELEVIRVVDRPVAGEITVERGVDGTSAVSWEPGAVIECRLVGAGINYALLSDAPAQDHTNASLHWLIGAETVVQDDISQDAVIIGANNRFTATDWMPDWSSIIGGDNELAGVTRANVFGTANEISGLLEDAVVIGNNINVGSAEDAVLVLADGATTESGVQDSVIISCVSSAFNDVTTSATIVGPGFFGNGGFGVTSFGPWVFAGDADRVTLLGFANESTNDASDSTAVGTYNYLAGSHGVAIGSSSSVNADNSVAIGRMAQVQSGGAQSVAIGHDALADSPDAVAVGAGAAAEGSNGIAIGHDAQADAASSVAIGLEAEATADYSMIFGAMPGLRYQPITGAGGPKKGQFGAPALMQFRNVSLNSTLENEELPVPAGVLFFPEKLVLIMLTDTSSDAAEIELITSGGDTLMSSFLVDLDGQYDTRRLDWSDPAPPVIPGSTTLEVKVTETPSSTTLTIIKVVLQGVMIEAN